MFDDILSLEHRDTSKTVVDNSDKQRFENSRRSADVRLSKFFIMLFELTSRLDAGSRQHPTAGRLGFR